MTGRRRSRSRRSARRTASRDPKRRLLVVCEGRRTEPDYIRGFERHVRSARVEIEIPKDQGDPKRVVEIAKEENAKAEAEATRQGDGFRCFDEVWCIFDRDKHRRFGEACEMARDNHFELVVSNPCFELWLLLHFTENPGVLDHTAMQRRLKKELPGYDKARLSFESFRQGVKDARARSRRLCESAEAMGEAGRNPTISFYRLIDSISRPDVDGSAE